MKLKHTLAGRAERLLANLIDTMLLLIPSGFLAAMFKDDEGLLTLLLFGLNMGYYIWFLSSSWQATPGKRLLSIYVIRVDRARLTQRDALERFLAFILPSLPLYTSLLSESVMIMLTFWLSTLWFLPILTTPERTGLHDRICKTRVVAGKADAV